MCSLNQAPLVPLDTRNPPAKSCEPSECAVSGYPAASPSCHTGGISAAAPYGPRSGDGLDPFGCQSEFLLSDSGLPCKHSALCGSACVGCTSSQRVVVERCRARRAYAKAWAVFQTWRHLGWGQGYLFFLTGGAKFQSSKAVTAAWEFDSLGPGVVGEENAPLSVGDEGVSSEDGHMADLSRKADVGGRLTIAAGGR